jgi:hypothetical protein
VPSPDFRDLDRLGPLTDNGIHFNEDGYRMASFALLRELRCKSTTWSVDIEVDKKSAVAKGTKLVSDKDSCLRFLLTDDSLPGIYRPFYVVNGEEWRKLTIRGLAAGDYTLFIDGKAVVTKSSKEWAATVDLYRAHTGPEFDQALKLRAAIIEKNRLYFHRWRPQNETYLFGFRKYEQGQNAVEIPKFDPLVAKQEEEIAELRVPVEHTYELKLQPAGGDKE